MVQAARTACEVLLTKNTLHEKSNNIERKIRLHPTCKRKPDARTLARTHPFAGATCAQGAAGAPLVASLCMQRLVESLSCESMPPPPPTTTYPARHPTHDKAYDEQ